MTANIIWIASYPKSGNTWTRAFLLYLFMNARERRPLSEMSDMSPIDASRVWFDEAVGEERESYSEEETAAWRVAAQRQILKRFDATSFVKTHSAFTPWHGHPMFDMSSTAGAIYIVRNPLDVVASFTRHSNKRISGIVEVMCEHDHTLPGAKNQVPQLIGSWSQNVLSWTGRPNPALHIMRYEDMVEDPNKAFGNLAAFLKIDVHPERLERAVGLASFDSLKAAEQENEFIERPEHLETFFRKGRVGGWREELTPNQARRIVDVHRDQMARFGYVPEGM